jgi:hypothetical protein
MHRDGWLDVDYQKRGTRTIGVSRQWRPRLKECREPRCRALRGDRREIPEAHLPLDYLHRRSHRALGVRSLGCGRCGRAPRGREDRETANHCLLRQDRGAKPAARHVQRQLLRSARIALSGNGPWRIRAGAFNPALFPPVHGGCSRFV